MHRSGSITVSKLAELLGARVLGDADAAITGLASIDDASGGDLTFVRDKPFAGKFASCAAVAAVTTEDLFESAPDGKTLLFVEDVDLAFAAALERFAEPAPPPPPGVHDSSIIDPTATVDPRAHIGPFCSVGPGATIGAAVLLERVSVGASASVADGCTLHPGAIVRERCHIGASSVIHSGVVVGGDGFGYRPAPDGSGLVKIPHLGGVRIGAHVEIGCNTTIDRGKLGDTVIGDGCKIDNLVQIGHNCRLGRCVILCGQVGLSGSVSVGDGAVLAGQVGSADNLSIAAGARIGAQAGLLADITEPGDYIGSPAWPAKDFLRAMAKLRDLPRIARDVRRLTDKAADKAQDSGAG